MNQTENIYIQLIANAVNDIHRSIDLSAIETDKLIALCKLHRNVGLVYSALMKQENVPQNIMEVFEKGFYVEMLVYSKRTTIFEMVLKELNKKEIKHVIVKGMSYAKCYQQSEFRTMGDMDLIVSPGEIKKVDKVLEELGGQIVYESSNQKVHNYNLKKNHIEIHTSIGYAGKFNDTFDFESYFRKAIEESVCIKECTYEFTPYDKVVYAIFHIAKHFYDSGCGVRMITDLAVLMKYYKSQLDMKRLWKELKEMKLKEFAQNLFAICQKWFGLETDGFDCQLENIEIIENYILSGGVFGHDSVLGDATQIVEQKGTWIIVKMFQWAFPNYRHMREYSEWFKDKPAMLLPVAYIERFIRNAKERGGVAAWIKKLKKSNSEKAVQKNILEIMGLSDEIIGEQ